MSDTIGLDDPELKPGEKDVLGGETCMFCQAKALTLTEASVEIPYFGMSHIFAMVCSSCGFNKADVEIEENKGPAKFTFDIASEKDLKVRVIRSSNATLKIPYVGEMEPGESASGFITNVEGVLNRFKQIIENMRDSAEEKEDQKKAKNLLKKINKALWGQEKLKLIIEDPTGNSAIISDKAVKGKL